VILEVALEPRPRISWPVIPDFFLVTITSVRQTQYLFCKRLPPLFEHIRIHHNRAWRIQPKKEVEDGRDKPVRRDRSSPIHEPPLRRDPNGVEDNEEGVSTNMLK